MNDLTPFHFEGRELRALTVAGEPWFVATDVARMLGYSEASAMTRTLDEDEKGLRTVQTLGGSQQVSIISESGLYSAILRSRVAGAKAFKRWVTHDVLPSIRRHGLYATEQTVDQLLADPDTAIRLLSEIKAERAKRAELEQQVQADAPKVIFANAVAAAQTDILVGDLAKILRGNGVEVGGTRLFRWLRRNGFLIRRDGADYNSPTQRAMELGLFRIKETAVTHSDGHVTISKTPKVTGKGQTYFVERFLSGAFSLDDEQVAA